ncbi:MAG: peptide-methionine (S)-S-oxide reductase MsrA [Planctomycetaceae bacterium]
MTQLATFGGGCFWCTEAVFQKLRGVSKVVSGYSNGDTENPTYHDICTGTTGHAEVIQISFDPEVISFEDLLDVHFATHDPTTLNQQGADRGTQYRSTILCHDDAQQLTAAAKIKELDASGEFSNPIVTSVEPIATFYPAEGYHQNYFNQNPGQPYCLAVIPPKLAKLQAKFAEKMEL